MTTLEEQLDELLGLARDVGRAANEVARWEHESESYGPRTWRGKNSRAFLRDAREVFDHASGACELARSRFLLQQARAQCADHSGGVTSR